MSKYGPVSAFLLVGGKNLSTDTFVLTESLEHRTEEVHGLGESWERTVPIGLSNITLEASGGLYDDRTAGIVEAFQSMGTTKQIVSFGFSGSTTIGKEAVLIDGTYATTWKRIYDRSALTKAHAEHRISGYYYRGQIAHALTAETADPGTGTSADYADMGWNAQDVTSSSVASPTVITTPTAHGLTTGDVVLFTGHSGATPALNGGDGYPVTVVSTTTFTVVENVSVGGTGGTVQTVSRRDAACDLHVTAITLGGFTDVVVLLEHSTDDSSFATYATFTGATVVGAERQTGSGILNRYTRITWDWTGSGSANTFIPYVIAGS